MKITDLRIGNIVDYETIYYRVDSLVGENKVILTAINHDWEPEPTGITEIEGIPLTPEILKTLGIQNLLEQDKDLLQDIRAERKVMDGVHAFLKDHDHPVDQWYYGHFHESWHSEIDGVKYIMLDCLELKELI